MYSTYLGGSGAEGGFGNAGIAVLGIAVDGVGNAYLSGTTSSADFPAVNALQPFAAGGGASVQAFIAKLNTSGSALEYSTPVNTFVERSSQVDIGIGQFGNAYISGGAGGNFPTTSGSPQPVVNGPAKSSATGETEGQEEYHDQGPVQPLNIHSINVQAIVCESGGTQASIFGQATINGAGSFIYRIRVQDLGEPGAGHDTYWLLLVKRSRGGPLPIHREDLVVP